MTVERTGAGLETRLENRGVGRLFGAGFLAFWLAGWAVGEVVVLWILGKGAWSLLTGAPLGDGDEPVRFAPAAGIGLFLTIWVIFWTFGGITAARELLRLLFGRDVVVANAAGLEVKRSYGLFQSASHVRADEIRRFYRTSPGAPLCVETSRGTIVVTKLGAAEERAELESVLNEQFHTTQQPAPIGGALPKPWCEVLSPEREVVLVKDPATRRKQARTAWIACAVVSLIPLCLLAAERQRPDLTAAAGFFALLAGLVGSGAGWLSLGRNEWRLDQGRVVLQRRFRASRTERFEAVSLELIEDNSGDGGPTYSLLAVASGAPARTATQVMNRYRRTISQSNDSTEPRNFGRWLSQRCGIPLTDLTTAEAKTKDLEELKQRLAGSGRLGRAALLLIERLAPAPPASTKNTGPSHLR